MTWYEIQQWLTKEELDVIDGPMGRAFIENEGHGKILPGDQEIINLYENIAKNRQEDAGKKGE